MHSTGLFEMASDENTKHYFQKEKRESPISWHAVQLINRNILKP